MGNQWGDIYLCVPNQNVRGDVSPRPPYNRRPCYTVLKGNSGKLSSKVSVLPSGTLSQNSDTERRVPELILVLSS